MTSHCTNEVLFSIRRRRPTYWQGRTNDLMFMLKDSERVCIMVMLDLSLLSDGQLRNLDSDVLALLDHLKI